MALTITDKRVTQTEKGFRANIVMKNTGFFGGSTETKFFFMGAGELDEKIIPEVAKEVIDKRAEWKQGKRSQTLALETIRSTAIITTHQNLD